MKKKRFKEFSNELIKLSCVLLLCSVIATLLHVNLAVWDSFHKGISINVEDIRDESVGGEVEDFLKVAERFALNHEYSKEYNCVNYSNDLAEIADALGFRIEKVMGWDALNESAGHEWLRLQVDFEPQLARFVDYSVKYVNQSIVKG